MLCSVGSGLGDAARQVALRSETLNGALAVKSADITIDFELTAVSKDATVEIGIGKAYVGLLKKKAQNKAKVTLSVVAVPSARTLPTGWPWDHWTHDLIKETLQALDGLLNKPGSAGKLGADKLTRAAEVLKLPDSVGPTKARTAAATMGQLLAQNRQQVRWLLGQLDRSARSASNTIKEEARTTDKELIANIAAALSSLDDPRLSRMSNEKVNGIVKLLEQIRAYFQGILSYMR